MGENLDNGKTKLGFLPPAKIASVVGAKLWAEHSKNAAALNAAREVVSKSKEQVREAIAKKLNLDTSGLDFYINGKDELILAAIRSGARDRAG
jgi:hypothetical protein